jgi:hypothetical protein
MAGVVRTARRLRRGLAGLFVGGVAALTGCGPASSLFTSPPPSCTTGAPSVEAALRRAPAPVRLADGTPISQCIARSTAQGDLESVGGVLVQAGSDIAARLATTPAAAVELGYLIGATERGAAHSDGVDGQIVIRVKGIAPFSGLTAVEVAALARGLRAGRADG